MKTLTVVANSQPVRDRESFGLRWQSAAATPLLECQCACESGVALRFPPQSKTRRFRWLAVLAIVVWLTLAASLSRAADDNATLKSVLPPPEFYVRHKEALNLTPAQGQSLREVLGTMNREFSIAQSNLTLHSRELGAAVEDKSLPADAVKQKLQALLQAENRAKEIRFDASLAARRLLTPEQWEKARLLTNAAPSRLRTGPAANLPEEVRAPLQKKLERVRALAREAFPSGPPPDFRRRLNEVQTQVRNGQVEAADKLFDQLIAEMEKRRDDAKRVPPNK